MLGGLTLGAGPTVDLALATGGETFQFNGPRGCTTHSGAEHCATGRALRGASSVAVSPDGLNAYVAANESSSVVTFLRGPASGRLVQPVGFRGCVSHTGGNRCVTGRGMLGAYSVAVSPDGRNVYVATLNGLSIFARHPAAGGALNQLGGMDGCLSETATDGCAPGRGVAAASAVIVSPDGQNVYTTGAESDAVAAFSRDPNTGALTQLPGPAGCISLAGTEGCATAGRGLGGAASAAISPSGSHVYVTGNDSDAVVVLARDLNTGALTHQPEEGMCVQAIGSLGCRKARAVRSPNGVAISPDGSNLYVASSGSDALAIFRIEANGTLSQLGGKHGCWSRRGADGCSRAQPLDGAFAVAVSPDERNVYVVSQRALAGFQRRVDKPRMGALDRRDCTSQGGDFGCATGRALEEGTSVALDRRGRNVYVAAYESAGVSAFVRDPQRGKVRVRLAGEPKRRCSRRPFRVKVRVLSRLPLRRTRIFVDGKRSHSTRSARFRVKIDPKSFPHGRHRLKIEAADVTGTADGGKVQFRRCRRRG